MSNVTMEDFIDECLEAKKPKKRKRIIEEKSTNISSIFEDDSVIDSKEAKEKEQKEKEKEKDNDITPESDKTEDKDVVLSMSLHINNEKKVNKFNKEKFANDLPLNFQSILKDFGYDLDQISQKAKKPESEAPETIGQGNEQEVNIEDKPKVNKFKLIVKEFITAGAGSEKVELSWRRDGTDEDAIETAEVITSNGSMPFNDNPDPLNSAISTFDRIYYDDIISKVREELSYEESSE